MIVEKLFFFALYYCNSNEFKFVNYQIINIFATAFTRSARA